jgi:ribosomal protein S18 acetylase RimI-like enzyme
MITLRPLTKDDLNFLLEVRNDDTTRVNLENDTIFGIEDCTKWFLNTKPKWFIVLNENKDMVGYLRTNEDEVGCDIHPKFRRKGYARMAYNEYLKDKNYANLWVFENNFAKELYKSLGFKETGDCKVIRDKNYIYMEYKKNE